MTKMFSMVVSLALIVTVAVSPVWAAGGKVRSDNAQGEAGEIGNGAVEASRGTPVGESVQILSVQEGVTGKKGQHLGTLTNDEIVHIKYMREEEKLARDVYLTLSEQYPAAIFVNISESEQRHMDALEGLIVKYGLEDPVKDETLGVFSNEKFAELYIDLVEAGEVSYCGALQAGIDIEDLDIYDIEVIVLPDVEAQDVNRVMNNLLSGSYNHLNAFTSRYEAAGCPIE